MKLKPYKEYLKMGKEKVAQSLAPVKAAKAKQKAKLKMAELDEEIATKEASLHEECSSEDVNFDSIINLQDRLGLLERKKKQYQKILDEMFPDD